MQTATEHGGNEKQVRQYKTNEVEELKCQPNKKVVIDGGSGKPRMHVGLSKLCSLLFRNSHKLSALCHNFIQKFS